MAPLTVLRLRTIDLPLVERQLRVKIAQLPQMFLDAPVLLDLGALGEAEPRCDLPGALRSLKACKLVPVAVANVTDAMRARAVEAGLGVLQRRRRPRRARPDAARRVPRSPSRRRSRRRAAACSAARPPPRRARAARRGRRRRSAAPHAGRWSSASRCAAARSSTRRTPTWSSSRRSTPGAQVIADGHVHIYAPLRGRAVAGAQGLPGARIFCQRLEAELVADLRRLRDGRRHPAGPCAGEPAQIYLEDGECRIAPL